MTPPRKDLWLARWSGAALAAADLAVGLSGAPAPYALGLVLLAGGCGLRPLLRSLLSGLVGPRHAGALNTVLGILETLGVMAAAPAAGRALGAGFAAGGAWAGLPFVAGAGVSLVGAGVLWAYRLPPPVGGGDEV